MVCLKATASEAFRTDRALLCGEEQRLCHQNECAQRPAQFRKIQSFQRRMISWTLAARSHSAMIARVQIDRGDSTIWWLEKRQFLRSCNRSMKTEELICGPIRRR